MGPSSQWLKTESVFPSKVDYRPVKQGQLSIQGLTTEWPPHSTTPTGQLHATRSVISKGPAPRGSEMWLGWSFLMGLKWDLGGKDVTRLVLRFRKEKGRRRGHRLTRRTLTECQPCVRHWLGPWDTGVGRHSPCPHGAYSPAGRHIKQLWSCDR